MSNFQVDGLNLDESERFSANVVCAMKGARLAAGISKYELARKSGISQTMIYRMEKGERNPTLVTVHALAKALGKDVGYGLRRVLIESIF